VLETLVARGVAAVVTTHYGDLKVLAGEHAGMVNASVAFDPERLVPTYRLRMGLPGASYAFPIARRHGLPDDVVAAAERRLGERPAAMEALLADIHKRAERLQAREDTLAQQERQRDEAERRLAARERELAQRERETKRRERGAVNKEIKEARRRIADVVSELQRAKSLPAAEAARRRLESVAREVLPEAPQAETPPLGAEGLARLRPGTTVYLPDTERTAELEEVLDEGRRARVRMGLLSMEVDADSLALPPQGATAPQAPRAGADTAQAPKGRRPKAEAAGEEGASITLTLTTEENTLDLRGRRVEAALDELDRFLDRCVVKHVSPILVIHGHGTGALKQAVRRHLSESAYVADHRPGGRREGSDGVTVAALNL